MVREGPEEDEAFGLSGGALPLEAAPLAAYAQAFATALAPLALTDLDGVLMTANTLFTERVGLPSPPARLPLAEFAPPLAYARELLHRGRVGNESQQGVLLRPDGGGEVICTVRLVPQPDGSPGWFMVLLPEAGALVLHDPLTGLPNRTLLLDRLTQALARRARTGTSIEVVVVDLDGFKQVNDQHGHLAGDAVLVEVARRLIGLVRPGDTVARWGGDEFVLLLETPARLSGQTVCGRIEAVLQRPVHVDHASVEIAASCGWANAAAEESATEVLHRADLAMFEAKRRGRAGGPALGPAPD